MERNRRVAVLLAGLCLGGLAGGVVAQDAKPAAATSSPVAKRDKLTVKPSAIYDVRVRHIGTPANKRRSAFQLIMRMTGDRVDEVSRLGFPIITDYVDDTGVQLVDLSKFAARGDETSPYRRAVARARRGFIDLPLDADVQPSRKATKLAHVAGHVWVVLGGPADPIFIPHAKRWEGRYLEHPVLEARGIRIRMLTPEEVPDLVGDERAFALAIEAGGDHVRNVAVYDPWLHNSRIQPHPDKQGELEYTLFSLPDIKFTEDCELGIYLFKNPVKQRVDFDFKDLDLP